MRALWGETIDRDGENRDYLRVGEPKAAVPVDNMVFPPLCPSCLRPNPQGVHAITVPEGYRAGLLHPIYVPHCKRCPLRAGLFRGSGGVWAGLVGSLVLAVAMLLLVSPVSWGEAEWRLEVVWSTFYSWPYVPFFWLGLAGVLFCGYLVHRRGIWVHAINEDTVIFGFKHPGYGEEFRKANRISGARKSAEELSEWEARLCPFCNRPLQRGQELCSFCGRRVPAEAVAPGARAVTAAAGAAAGAAAAAEPPTESVESGARQAIEALAERATRSGLTLEEWPKTVRCQCGRKYRLRHPGTYHCVDAQCGRTFIVE